MTGPRRARIIEWIRRERDAGRLQRESVQHAAERCAEDIGEPVTAIELRTLWHAERNQDALRRSAERAKGLHR